MISPHPLNPVNPVKNSPSLLRALRVFVVSLLFLSSCSSPSTNDVIIYTALDEMYSRPILEKFEAQTGIRVLPVYDTEASKTTGLVARILAESSRPRADVFWNNEVAQTIVLKEKGALEAYASPNAAAFPAQFKDPDAFWCGFAARGRVIIYNTALMPDAPTGLQDFLDPKYKGKCAIALPLFGTTATHGAALFALWGDEKAKAFFNLLQANDVALLAGNATVRDFVAQGEYAFGLTDTDDANGAIEDGLPVKWVFPDQDGDGTLLIPNSVALIKNAPHPDSARKLIDYLLSPEVEAQLAAMRSIQIPLNPAVSAPDNVPKLKDIKTMPLTFQEIAAHMANSGAYFKETFLK